MDIKETLQEAGQKLSEGAKNVKDAIVAKLSEENAQTPQQRLKNAQAMLDGAKVAEGQAKTALQAVQAEGDKYKRYAASAESKGDFAGVQKFENMMQGILEKIPALEISYNAAAAKREALEDILEDLKANMSQAPKAPHEDGQQTAAEKPVAIDGSTGIDEGSVVQTVSETEGV